MVEFGDEFIVESYRIPWLIWIQLLVTILLVILLFFGFNVFTSDPSTSSSSSASPPEGRPTAPPTQLDKPSSSRRRTKVEDQRRVNRDAGTSGGPIREDDENGTESSMKDSTFLRFFRHPSHPCNYFGLVKQAFFKCFGIDSSSSHQHEKQE